MGITIKEAMKLQAKTRSKYHNKSVVVDGERFDSVKEAERWHWLCLMQKAGVITDLRRQVPFELIPAQKLDGKVVERPVRYIADFVYIKGGETIVEDAKGVRTKEYVIKRKLMLYEQGIRVKEV